MTGLDELYREVILEHYRTPHGADTVDSPDVEVEGHNPLCGDELVMQLDIEDGRIRSMYIEPSGCSISVASASMLTQQLEGATLRDAIELKRTFQEVMKGGDWPEGLDPGDLEALEGVKQFPVRIKCATVGLDDARDSPGRVRCGARRRRRDRSRYRGRNQEILINS